MVVVFDAGLPTLMGDRAGGEVESLIGGLSHFAYWLVSLLSALFGSCHAHL